MKMHQPVGEILKKISSTARRIVIIHDPLMAIVIQDAAAIFNAECYPFNCIPVFPHLSIVYQILGKPFPQEKQPKGIPSLQGVLTEDMKCLIVAQEEYLKYKAGGLHNTSRVIEGEYLDLLLGLDGDRVDKKEWAIGPILPTKLCSNRKHKCLDWLDHQAPNSVLYVSFGTTTSMSDKQVKELAKGLEESDQNFIWVLRDADKGDIFYGKDRIIELPEGFEERTKRKGMVYRDWAPQPEILAHPSTGGFMGHCGWNSCIESITMGVPIAAWPMHSDQPWNAILGSEMLKTSIIVREWERREERVSSSTIANVVKRLMASEEGEELRRRAEEVGDVVRKSTQEGGVSRKELDSFVAHITR